LPFWAARSGESSEESSGSGLSRRGLPCGTDHGFQLERRNATLVARTMELPANLNDPVAVGNYVFERTGGGDTSLPDGRLIHWENLRGSGVSTSEYKLFAKEINRFNLHLAGLQGVSRFPLIPCFPPPCVYTRCRQSVLTACSSAPVSSLSAKRAFT
jgi:hypothetical protein